MSLQITLPAQLEERLRQEAERHGQSLVAVALGVLDQYLPSVLDPRRAAAVSLLRGWAQEDESLSQDELAANADILRSLDEDRPSSRKLFQDLLKEMHDLDYPCHEQD